MSDYRDVAGWCEHRADRRTAVSVAVFPTSIALYPADKTGLGEQLVRAAGNATWRALRHPERVGSAPNMARPPG